MTTKVAGLNPRQDYIDWICPSCAAAAGKSWEPGRIETFHIGTCDVCGATVAVCSPRAWGHLSEAELSKAREAASGK